MPCACRRTAHGCPPAQLTWRRLCRLPPLSPLPLVCRSFTSRPSSRACPSWVRSHGGTPLPGRPPLPRCPPAFLLRRILNSSCRPISAPPPPAVHDEIKADLKEMGLPTEAKGNAGQGARPAAFARPVLLHPPAAGPSAPAPPRPGFCAKNCSPPVALRAPAGGPDRRGATQDGGRPASVKASLSGALVPWQHSCLHC